MQPKAYRCNGDWESIYHTNATHEDTFITPDGHELRNYSKVILSNYLATHYWYGVLSNFNHEIGDRFKLTAGIHARNFKSRLRQEIDDLMGGEFWIEDYAWAIEGRAGRPMIKKKGDVIKVDNGALVKYASTFGQLEYRHNSGSAFISRTLSNTWYQREDRYNHVANIKSPQIKKMGFDIKAGTVFSVNENHYFYTNSGFTSREPYFKFVFVNFSNAVTRDLKNEGIAAAEIGYGFSNHSTRIRLNAYSTYWMDKSLLSMENVQLY